jgi:hypothetical protein
MVFSTIPDEPLNVARNDMTIEHIVDADGNSHHPRVRSPRRDVHEPGRVVREGAGGRAGRPPGK